MKKPILISLFVGLLAWFCHGAGGVTERAPRGDAHVAWANLREADIVPGELLVGYREAAVVRQAANRWSAPGRLAAVRRALGLETVRQMKRLPVELVRLPAGSGLADLERVAKRLAADPDVDYVEPNYRVQHHLVPNDPAFPNQMWGMEAIEAAAGWDVSTGSDQIVAAVIDTGMRLSHEDLVANQWVNPGEIPGNNLDDDGNGYVDDVRGWDFVNNDNDPTDDVGHGSHCAGTIGGVGNNGKGVVGVSWKVGLFPIKGLGPSGGSIAGLTAAIEYLSWFNGQSGRPRIHLSNNSWGGGGFSYAMVDAIEASRLADQLFVASAGNDNSDNDSYPAYPASYPADNIISVASLDQGSLGVHSRSSFSNYGLTTVDLGAPGGGIYSTYNGADNNYTYLSGTSMAGPHVAGAAALLYSIAPGSPYTFIRDAIVNAASEPAHQVPDLLNRTVTGGELNLPAAIRNLAKLVVTPRERVKMVGPPGGPFVPDTLYYGLRNAATNAIDWQMTASTNWLTVYYLDSFGDQVLGDPLLGTLAGAGSETVIAVTNAETLALPEGRYVNTLSFTNLTSLPPEALLERPVWLKVSYNYQFQSTPYAWVEPGLGATNLTISQLGATAVPIPFPFRFYNAEYAQLWVHANGAISLADRTLPASPNTALPNESPENAFIFPLWDELRFISGTTTVSVEHVTSTLPQRTIVTWRNMGIAAASGVRLDFQAVLYENQADNSAVACHYRNVAQDSAYGAARQATVGLQDDGAFQACAYTFNGDNADYGTMWLADRQGLLYTWRDRLPDADAPYVTDIRVLTCIPGDNVANTDGYAIFEVRFNEIVLGLEPGDFDLSQSTVPGVYVSSVTGGGERFLIEVEGFRDYGRIVIGLPGGKVIDLAGNPNLASPYYTAVVPFAVTHLFDRFENGQGLWTTSTNVYSQFTAKAWELGAPPSVSGGYNGLYWPTAAYSGNACWGTVLSNYYPSLLNGWLQAPRVFVADRPVVDFRVCLDLGYGYYTDFLSGGDYGVVEVSSGSGWQVVGVMDFFSATLPPKTYGAWDRYVVELPSAYANRAVDIRVRMVSDIYDYGVYGPEYADGAGIYIDDFRVLSLEAPGVWLLDATPTPLATGNTYILTTRAYNSSTQEQNQVNAVYGLPDSAIKLLSDNPVPYGFMLPGDIYTSQVVRVQTELPAAFSYGQIPLMHDAFLGTAFVTDNAVPLNVQGISGASRTKTLTAQALSGVKDWLGRPLSGNGSRSSSLFQLISAGADGQIDTPTYYGAPTDDDRVVYTFYDNLPYGRFGADNVSPNLGHFNRAFLHGLAANTKVYVRAWDAATFDLAVAYGNSALYTLTSATSQTRDFGGWTVGTPTQYRRDSNGDTIPDGWAIAMGLDPRDPITPLAPLQDVQTNLRGGNDDSLVDNDIWSPRRAAALGSHVYVVSRKNVTEYGSVLVYNSTLTTRKSTVNSVTTGGSTYRFDPTSLCVDTNRNRVIVTDNGDSGAGRVLIFDANPTTGALTYRAAAPAFGTSGTPDQTGRFKNPQDVAVDAAGSIYAIDSQKVGSTYRIQRLTSEGLSPVVLAYLPVGASGYVKAPSAIAVDQTRIVVADPDHGLVRAYSRTSGGYLGTIGGGNGSGLGQMATPAGLSIGIGGRIYVMEQANNRLQIFSSTGTPLAVYPAATLGNPGYFGSELGQFRLPEGVFVWSGNRHRALVADTGNARIQWLELLLDVDGDGMDDVWEDYYFGSYLVCDPALDADGDGLSNLGEYRARTNPRDPDSNDNGGGDLWDMINGRDPLGSSTPTYAPPKILSLVSDATGTLVAGQTVRLTATFSESIAATSGVKLQLQGGAVTLPLTTTRVSATVYRLFYTVDGDDAGPVTGTLSGAFDLSSLEQDPVAYAAGTLFTVGAPPTVLSVVSDAIGPAIAGQNVTLTVTFSKDISPAATVRLELQGGVVTLPLAMTRNSATQYQLVYTVDGDDFGPVSGIVSGAVDLEGLTQDPSAYVTGTLFDVGAADFWITAISVNPLILEWDAVASATYKLQDGPTPTGAWNDVTTQMAPVTGTLGYTNVVPLANPLRFYRVQRVTP